MGAVAPLDGQDAVDGRIGEGGVQIIRPLPVIGGQIAVAVLVAAGGVDHRLQAQGPHGVGGLGQPLRPDDAAGAEQRHPGAGEQRLGKSQGCHSFYGL